MPEPLPQPETMRTQLTDEQTIMEQQELKKLTEELQMLHKRAIV